MHTRTATRYFTIVLPIAILTLQSMNLEAQFQAGVGGDSCREVKRQITRNWTQLSSFLRRNNESLKRPKAEDFFCISPRYTRNVMQKRTGSFDMKCYSVEGQKFCCDKKLTACAGLSGR